MANDSFTPIQGDSDEKSAIKQVLASRQERANGIAGKDVDEVIADMERILEEAEG